MDYSKKTKKELINELILLQKFEDTTNIKNNVNGVIENISECIYNVKFDNNKKSISYISSQIEDITGLTIEEFTKEELSGDFIKRIHPKDKDNVEKNIYNGLYNFKLSKINTVFRYKKKDKEEYIWLDETIYPKYNGKGKIVEATTVLRNVNEKSKSLETLQTSENSYKELFNSSPELIYILNKKGEIIDVNETVLKKYGHAKDTLVGKTFLFLGNKEKNKDIDLLSVVNKVWNGNPQKFEWWGEKKHKEEFLKELFLKKATYFNRDVIIANGRDVTEKKIIEEHLKQNEERYRNLFTKNMAGVFITENKTIVECNNAFAKIFGYNSRVELIGKNAGVLYFSNEDRNKYLNSLKKTGFLTNFKNRQKNKNGEEVWVSANITYSEIYNHKKKGIRIEGTLVDITEQVNYNKQLKQSEENYKNLIEQSPYGIIIHNMGKIIFVNNKASEILGVENVYKSSVAKYLLDYLVPKNKNIELLKSSQSNKEKSDAIYVEVQVKSPSSGKIIDLQANTLPIIFQSKNAMQVVFQDVSAQKQLQQIKIKNKITEEANKLLHQEIKERIKIEQELVINKNYTEKLIASSLDIICSTDESEKFKEFNKAAEISFGYTKKQILNLKPDILYSNKDDYDKINKELEEKGIFIGEVENISKTGKIFTSFLSATVLKNDEGLVVGTMGVSRDITEIKKAEQELVESEERYRDLFENASDLIQSISADGKILYVNNSWKKTLGYSNNEIIGQSIYKFIHTDGINHCTKFFENLVKVKGVNSDKTIIELLHKNGSKIYVEGYVGCKMDSQGGFLSTRGIFRDVTDERRINNRQKIYNTISKIIAEKTNEEEIYEEIRQELLSVINTDIFIISYANSNNTISFPYYYDKTLGGRVYRASRDNTNGINEYFLKQKKSIILKRADLDRLIEEGKYTLLGKKCKAFLGVPLKVKNNVVGVLSVQSYDNENEFDGNALEILDFISGPIALTIQKKQDEKILFEQTSKLNSIIENSSHMFWTYDKQIGLVSYNQNYSDAIFDLYGFRPEILPNKFNRLDPLELQGFWNKKYEVVFSGKKLNFITERKNKNGERTIKEVFLNPIFDENQNVVLVSGIAHDITEKQIVEENLLASLKEKEVLLKEVHHRVKNNLQVISSILNLQSSYSKDKKTITILKESQDRIKSMSIIHESLYQTNDFSKINFSQYIVTLSKNLVFSYSNLGCYVETKFNIDDVSLSLDVSIPCGLIINELVSNALKYAFKGKEKGKITISLLKTGDLITLTIKDNGVGIPKNINISNTNTLGLQLVTTLVEQIDAEIVLEINKGTKFTITFKQT